MSYDASETLCEQISTHLANQQAIQICAGGSKDFYGRKVLSEAVPVDVTVHHGIVHYEPTELVITARCGTALSTIETTLAEHGQMLAFEPPYFGDKATLGGCVASGLSGPRRPFAGATRDSVLGIKLINGRGNLIQFGGEVMKNVAGYDVSRLMTGSLGTLGVITDVSLKVLPKPVQDMTLVYEMPANTAIKHINTLCAQPHPITATCFDGDKLLVRLSGHHAAIKTAHTQLGGEVLDDNGAYWHGLREQTLGFFQSDKPLWRLSIAPNTPPIELEGKQLIEWRGAQRWLFSDLPAEQVRQKVASLGGHATLFRHNTANDDIFHPLEGKLHELHLNLKLAMDPNCLFNPGRMYPDF